MPLHTLCEILSQINHQICHQNDGTAMRETEIHHGDLRLTDSDNKAADKSLRRNSHRSVVLRILDSCFLKTMNMAV